uniref:aldehyde dehydrogenase family protein n=1 Tax=Streptomyces malaysiensis TaxID=92644 RepID=UPI003850864C
MQRSRPRCCWEGFSYPPTVLTGVDDSMLVMTEETFGPIAPVAVVADFAAGLERAAASRYGLAATVYTDDPDHIAAASRLPERPRSFPLRIRQITPPHATSATQTRDSHVIGRTSPGRVIPNADGASGNAGRVSKIVLLDEREVLTAMLDREPDAVTDRPGLLLIADKGFASKEFEADLALRGAELLRPSFKREKRRKGESLLESVRQLIESVNDTLKGQLDLEQHGGRTFEGVAGRVAQSVLALAAAIWHNHKTGQPVMRSLIAYDS